MDIVGLTVIKHIVGFIPSVFAKAQRRLIKGAYADKQRSCLHAEYSPNGTGDFELIEVQHRILDSREGGAECLDCHKRFPHSTAGKREAEGRIVADARKNMYGGEIIFRT